MEEEKKKKKASSSSAKDKDAGGPGKGSSTKDKKASSSSSKDKDEGSGKKKSSSSSGAAAAKDPSSSKRSGSGAAATAKPNAAAPPPPAPRRPPPPPKAAPQSDYLAGVDLPSSESSSDEEGRGRGGAGREEARGALAAGGGLGNDKEARKAADRERLALEKSLRMKQEALREDANVFDVSYEGMGGDDAPAATAQDVKVNNLTVRAKGKPLLENTALTVVAGRRYGLAGPNGRGKTTLLKLLARRQIPVPEGIDVLLVEQEVVGTDDQTALAAVVAADGELMELRAEEARLNDILLRGAGDDEDEAGAGGARGAAADGGGGGGANGGANSNGNGKGKEAEGEEDDAAAGDDDASAEAADGSAQKKKLGGSKKKAARAAAAAALAAAAARADDPSNALPEPADPAQRLNEVYERMNELGASTAEARASKILHGLGFSEAMQRRVTSSFSGGWRMRISLARALYVQPTLLLLDEPTNHLDLRAVLWLEEYLTRWKKTLVVVSHDRDFLNSVTTDVIHLHDNALHFYRGNFAQFEEMYEQKRREVNKAFDKYEKQLKAAKSSGKSSKQAADKVQGKGKKEKSGGAGGGGGGMAESSRDGGPNAAPQKWSDYTVSFSFPEPTELPPPLMQLVDAGFRYAGRDDFGLEGLNIGVDMGSRVAIVGPNGAGKTTLMNLLSGDLVPNEGESRRSHKLRIGRYAQHFVDALEMDVNPVEYLLHKYPESGLRPEQMRAMLGRFGLSGSHHLTPIVKLSGGQKARVVFASIALSQPHILLLDEPTNHLDMQSIDALCDALEEFQGGVIVISHDAQLLSRLCADEERSEVWLVEDGTVETYAGDFEDYRSSLAKEIVAELDESAAQEAAAREAAEEKARTTLDLSGLTI